MVKSSKGRPKKDPRRERRITMEIVVDAYDADEQMLGWTCYLEEKLKFPFQATCIAERFISPLSKGDKVEVVEMAPENECRREMFVGIRFGKRTLGVPLSQLKPHLRADKGTKEAIADWQYWLAQGYE